MTVPQYCLPPKGIFRRIHTLFRFRPKFLHIGIAYCGTAMAVPYNI